MRKSSCRSSEVKLASSASKAQHWLLPQTTSRPSGLLAHRPPFANKSLTSGPQLLHFSIDLPHNPTVRLFSLLFKYTFSKTPTPTLSFSLTILQLVFDLYSLRLHTLLVASQHLHFLLFSRFKPPRSKLETLTSFSIPPFLLTRTFWSFNSPLSLYFT